MLNWSAFAAIACNDFRSTPETVGVMSMTASGSEVGSSTVAAAATTSASSSVNRSSERLAACAREVLD